MKDLEIFHNAPEGATPGELAAYLDEACGGDAALRSRVEALIDRWKKEPTDDFLEDAPLDLDAPTIAPGGKSSGKASPAPTPSASGTAAASLTEKSSDVIGPFTLIEKLGEGGFGTVWKAKQSVPISRTVALKILKRGMDSDEVIVRFEAERQALAVMDHPNIAKVHDAGATETGRPYFVMELVAGTPLTQYCDDHQLNLNDRLDLFTQVCAGVQHAHQKGIIHRDLKPPNVLVVEHDGKPVPKVIDFGIAKAIGQELTGKTLETMAGQIIGTPVYMSPEQASGLGQAADIDTRSDVYSLGVILYELLTGRLPFEPKTLVKAGLAEVERIIREVEPPKLSSRIVKLTDADQTTIALARDTQPGKLARFFRGDLEWIVMMALSKERERRYETATAFAKDVQHYLHHEPVEAGPPSAIYRMKRYARKHRRPLAAAALFITGLLALTIWALSERDYAREQTRAARIEEGKAWMERAAYYKEKPGQEFYAALMAARAIGFDGFRSPDTNKSFPFPLLFERGTSNYAAARREAQRFCRHPRPIWRTEGWSVAFSPDGRTLASGSLDGSIMLWDTAFLFNSEFTDLAAYLTDGWLEMNGREVTWTAKSGFLNVPENCHIAMLHRGATPEELLWQYSRARNWNAVLNRFREVENPAVKEEAARHLIRWLRLDAEKDAITAGLAEFRLGQLHSILPQADQESDPFVQMERAVGSALERSERAGVANASDAAQ